MIMKGRISPQESGSSTEDFHSFLIDSLRKIVSYHCSRSLNDYEIYHEIKLTSRIEDYELLISDDEKNKGQIEYYYDIQYDGDTILIDNKIAVIFEPPTILNTKEYKKYIRKEPRLRNNFDSNKYKIEIKTN
jgi:hypothetical protein